MRAQDLDFILEHIVDNLYGFAQSLIEDELICEQIVLDSYSAYILKNKKELASLELDQKSKSHRRELKKTLLFDLYTDVFQMAKTKIGGLIKSKTVNGAFFSLAVLERAVMYLKEVQGLSIEEIQTIFSLQRHEVLECLHNSRHKLLGELRC